MNGIYENQLNKLYCLSLKFGKPWMRPLIEWANKKFPKTSPEYREQLCQIVEKTQNEINEFIQNNFEYENGLTMSEKQVALVIKEKYPWMSKKNISYGISRGLYYAWHG